MKYSNEQFKCNWKKDIETFSYLLSYPFISQDQNNRAKILSSVPDESTDIDNELTRYSDFTYFNATIGQNYDDYQYSYEEGYFKAFKLVIAGSPDDSDSFVMPALFLARHYIELSLKDEILNISIATGSKLTIGDKENHNLLSLGNEFKKLLDDNHLDILSPQFFDIIKLIASLTPKSDEFRYTFDIDGKYNLPINFTDNNSFSVINLIALSSYLNYVYIRLHSLLFILTDDESVFSGTVWDNPYVKGLLYGIIHSKSSKSISNFLEKASTGKIKNWLSSLIANNNLKIQSKDISISKQENHYQVLLGGQKIFMLFRDKKSWYLKTPPLIS